MNSSDDTTIQAFMLALPQLDEPLPVEMKQAIHQIGHQLENQQQDVAAREIRELVTHHPRLEVLYQAAYEHLQQRYQAHESVQSSGTTGTPLSLATVSLPWQKKWAVPILTADNPREVVRSIAYESLSRLDARVAMDDSGILLASLAKVVQSINAQELPILKALEYHPLSVEDLTFTVGMRLEQVKTILGSLWQSHYVDVSSSSLWQRILPILKPEIKECQVDDPSTYFTLTMKGRFRLHPLIKIRDF